MNLQVLRRISWGAVASVLFMVLATIVTLNNDADLGVVLGLCSIAWALLSLKDEPTQ